ncbi:serine protease [Actinorhabdospora filicis]|uniref:Serine protease n=1 Tax=Actinorhabdospora filicis TaxID=1785913 RepID=A0A9W6WE96_9ACTN|nr:S8 family serine peptidase [Actinorhabdospora filicis]GLZ81665.1 serine protease [Actinorhabdospora filicis]
MRTRSIAAMSAALFAFGLLNAPPAGADPGDTVPTARDDGGERRELTLITGDRVVAGPDGSFAFHAGEGRRDVGYSAYRDARGDTHMVPADAAGPVRDGRLDPRLFDVTALFRNGYSERRDLPLLIEGGAAKRAGARLASLDAAPVAKPVGELGAFWAGLASARSLSGGRIWLDGTSRQLLDVSVPQVGAPAAWAAGFDGAGVTVAVLDGGYDPGHPDLAGRVAEARSFVGGDAVDRNGHGTHVASTVAGSGAASQGRYKGVAPGAKLLVGKVCGDDGRCPDSAIIAGMEWAAAQGAPVVNLSLGGDWTDGTDPLSLALNRISEETGTLFVVAAGNDGDRESVNSPGSAEKALTVGSVTKSDELSWFSSLGPRVGDAAVKPDIAAPGSDITAAAAAGTGPEGQMYATHSGTSMATPHVTGAAAIVKQAHPDWTAERIKSALMNGARDDGLSVFAEGAGRLDVARSVAQTVLAEGSLSFGHLAFGDAPVTRTVTYTNTGDAPVTLNLSVRGGSGLFTVDATSLTIPAGGTAQAVVTAAPGTGTGAGDLGADLLATSGDTVVTTALGAVYEGEKYPVDVTALGRDGEAVTSARMTAVNLSTSDTEWLDFDGEGHATARLAPGSYRVGGTVETAGTVTVYALTVSIGHGPASVTVDAGRASAVRVDLTDRDGERLDTQRVFAFLPTGESTVWLEYGGPARLHLLTDGDYAGEWGYTASYLAGKDRYNIVHTAAGVPGRLDLSYADAQLAREDTVYEGRGVASTAMRYDVTRGAGFFAAIVEYEVPVPVAGTTGTLRYTPGVWSSQLFYGDLDSHDSVTTKDTPRAAGDRFTRRWNSAPLGSGIRDDRDIVFRDVNSLYVTVPMFTGPAADTPVMTRLYEPGHNRMKLSVDGRVVYDEGTDPARTYIDLPPGTSGRFTLECEVGKEVPWTTFGTRSKVAWTFGSEAPPDLDNITSDISTVRLDATGVRNGVARRVLPQLVTMTVDHARADNPGTASLTFEVSYDEGESWTAVPVARFGETAVAALIHPAGATSVSTRVSTVDKRGNTSAQEMIRSYGLA